MVGMDPLLIPTFGKLMLINGVLSKRWRYGPFIMVLLSMLGMIGGWMSEQCYLIKLLFSLLIFIIVVLLT